MKNKTLIAFNLSCVLLGLWTGCATHSNSPANSNVSPAAKLAVLPETVTSFGAITTGNWLYVFGGHKGERHDYNVEMVSGSFHRLNLADGKTWEKLPAALPAQGVPLVAHDHYLYRLGGMAARNHAGTKQDLYSMSLVQRFDARTGQWEDFTTLPAPRSSDDAVVIGHKLYVAGGWQLLGGTNAPVWPANALMLDLSDPHAKWKEFPQPFKRRALALASVGTRIFCIGGMDSNTEPTLAVDIYDTATGQWSSGPQLPPGKFKGFSCSAIAQDGRIYANTFQGDLLRLTTDTKAWEVVGRVEYPRLSHRLVTAGRHQLIVLGGEDGEDKRPELELLTPSVTGKPVSTTTQSASNSHH